MHFDPSRFEYSIQTSNAVILFLKYNQKVKLFFKTLTGLAPVMHLQTAEISRQTHPLRFSAPFSDGSTFLALINLNPIFLTFTQFLKSMCPKVKEFSNEDTYAHSDEKTPYLDMRTGFFTL